MTIDAIACNGAVATAVREAGADYLLAVKATGRLLVGMVVDFKSEW